MRKTQIRDSEIDKLFERVQKRQYRNYLSRMRLMRIRGFRETEITFDFPVTALVGPNGSGKTTVLGSAALIYGGVKPRRFFAKSGRYDESMQNWRVEYDLIDKNQSSATISRTASYLKAKWNRDAVEREVLVFGVTRTLPASERKELSRCISGDFEGVSEANFSPDVITAVERILGKEATNYLKIDADIEGKVSIFAARSGKTGEPANESYSEFHFGAGEASVIRIVSKIESAEPGALILIEELENGLHPVATQRLVEYLVDVARRKSAQIIFTTHSNDAISPLPTNAVWAVYRGKVSQGKLDVATLRTLTGEIDARLAIFTEDAFGELVADVTLRAYTSSRNLDRASIEIHQLNGAANARDQMRYHNKSPIRRFPAIALLDGDKNGEAGYEPQSVPKIEPETGVSDVAYIPGSVMPEAYILEKIIENIDEGNILGKLTVALQLDTPMQARVREVIIERSMTNRERHLVFSQIGEDLDFLSEHVVQRAFVSTWAYAFPEDIQSIWEPCHNLLPRFSG
ncbi:putative ATPase [Nocardiopsis sp. Huas11]|uniref:ATP-dependent nuclease n=1 Tax=Nocardiopsis sp. Huas11 TaxID=2183912 RepID=UPI000EB2963F|nr:AAA family ATPase [Nocardiopsis sp. Huas11]RKS07062.1 putative ATPase [Nocardiopsis sp. Huas11]